MEFVFNPQGDYKAEFVGYVDTLYSIADSLTRKQRIDLVDKLTNAYITATGKLPNHIQLDRLATLILREEVTDRSKNKMRKHEYPVLSDRQKETRERVEVASYTEVFENKN